MIGRLPPPQAIYPPNKPINETNCEKLVTIANEFNMFELLRRCEKFLIKEKTPTLVGRRNHLVVCLVVSQLETSSSNPNSFSIKNCCNSSESHGIFLKPLNNPPLPQKLLVFAQKEHLTRLLQKCTKFCSRMNLDELKKSAYYAEISPGNLCNLLEVRCVGLVRGIGPA